jgi:hypothetical protein
MCSHLIYNKLAIGQLLLLTDGKELSRVLGSASLKLLSSVKWTIIAHNSRAACANTRDAYLAFPKAGTSEESAGLVAVLAVVTRGPRAFS